VNALREQHIKNFFTILMLSQGGLMFLMGDEVRRTQQGNNNTYCQNNDMGWSQSKSQKGSFRFCQQIIAFRVRYAALRRGGYFEGETNDRGLPDVNWLGTRLLRPGWDDPEARILAFILAGFDGDNDIHVMMNLYWDGEVFDLPKVEGRSWH
jgi:isoamylase